MIEDGVARFRIAQGDSCMWNEKVKLMKDFILEFDTRLVSGDTTSLIMIDFHSIESNHHFFLNLFPADWAWNIGKWWGSYFNMPSGKDIAIGPVGMTMHTTIIVRGSQFAWYIGQTPMAFFEDIHLDNSGETFFHCSSISPAECEFDNIKYWNLANIPGLP